LKVESPIQETIKEGIQMMSGFKGRVWKFGDNVDTDVICAGRFINSPLEEMRKHVFESIRPEFAAEAQPGDIIVAGAWFGSGSSRETAPAAIKALGIAAVVAESFSRNFYRNAIAIGLPAIACPKAGMFFDEKDEANISFSTGQITNLTSGKTTAFESFPDEMLQVLESGGIEYLLKKMFSS
jgi:3-isopropylmalate/(R)-2-methylmalate dehydratase small subunit